MKLLTKKNLNDLPALYSQDGKGDQAIAYVKFFRAGYTWYATEYNPEEETFFGLVIGQVTELGYWTLDQLKSVNAERDMYWDPRTIEKCRKAH